MSCTAWEYLQHLAKNQGIPESIFKTASKRVGEKHSETFKRLALHDTICTPDSIRKYCPFLTVNIFIEEDKYWVAHCLELDLVTSSLITDRARVERNIHNVIKAQLLYAIEHETALLGIFRPINKRFPKDTHQFRIAVDSLLPKEIKDET